MKELKCPKCGEVFSVDEADYAIILSQVKNKEFELEVSKRLAELKQQADAQRKIDLADKDKVIAELQAKVNQNQTAMELALSQQLNKIQSKIQEKDNEIAELKSVIKQNEANLQLAIAKEHTKAQETSMAKDQEIMKLKNDIIVNSQQSQSKELAIRQEYETRLKITEDQLRQMKDFKTKLSTKMVGETLEEHCWIQFEQFLRPLMPNAYFEKDNEVIEGTKGDFIFRDYADSDDDSEYVSIMFEMKNEMDTTATKHKNEDFLKKLDEDRKKKNCEYAVLVSLLESDSELYNTGIVDRSHKYEKMYVIRPQFFVPFVTMLVKSASKTIDYKRQLKTALQKDVDVTNFENTLEGFKTKFGRHIELANTKFADAIKHIDDTIKKLQSVKEDLLGSERNLELAGKDTENLTIRKLTRNNPTMKAKFEEARALNENN